MRTVLRFIAQHHVSAIDAMILLENQVESNPSIALTHLLLLGFRKHSPSPPRERRPRGRGRPRVRKCASGLIQYASEDSPWHPTAPLNVSASPTRHKLARQPRKEGGGKWYTRMFTCFDNSSCKAAAVTTRKDVIELLAFYSN